MLRVESEDGRLQLPKWWWQLAVVAILVLSITAVTFTTPEGFANGTVSQFEYDTLMAVVCSIALSLVVLSGGQHKFIVSMLERPGLVAVGVVSYSLFLWQVPVLLWMRNHGLVGSRGNLADDAGSAILVLTIPFFLSILTYRFIEFPALRRKKRSAPRVSEAPGRQQEVAPAP